MTETISRLALILLIGIILFRLDKMEKRIEVIEKSIAGKCDDIHR